MKTSDGYHTQVLGVKGRLSLIQQDEALADTLSANPAFSSGQPSGLK